MHVQFLPHAFMFLSSPSQMYGSGTAPIHAYCDTCVLQSQNVVRLDISVDLKSICHSIAEY